MTAMSDDPHLAYAQRRVGTVIRGKYRIDRVVGVGGMAVVYAATSHIERRVAIKILHPEYGVRSDAQLRLQFEAVAANRVGHAHAVDVHDCDTSEDGSLFLVMDLLEGMSLDKLAERAGPRLPLEAVLAVAYQALDVLDAAHAKGIVHRDIKPENLFLTADGSVKVLDFGIARVRDRAETKAHATRGYLGTPAFMAPEQARCDHPNVDGQTDVWAVGATLFKLLTGRFVYEAESAQAMMVCAATRPAPALLSVVGDLPHAVGVLVDRATAADKSQRWASARAMAQAVRQTQHAVFGRIVSPPPPSELLGMPCDPNAATVAASAPWSPRAASVGAVVRSAPSEQKAPRRRVGGRAGLVSLAGAAGVAAALGLAFAMRHALTTASAGTPSAAAAPAAPQSTAIACGSEQRVALDCAARSNPAGGATTLPPDADARMRQAVDAIERQRRDLSEELGQLCEEYNKCVLDRATYAERSDDIRRRLAAVPPLLANVQGASTDQARRVALSDAYQKIVPEADRTELKLDFSALARRPGEATMAAAPPNATIPTGSQLAFSVGVSRSAYVYIFEKTATGTIHVLFPDPVHITVDEPLAPGTPLRIPQGGAFFRVDDEDLGAESVYLLASLKPIASVGRAADQLRLGQRPAPVLARVTSIDSNCGRTRGLIFDEGSPAPPGCQRMRGLTFESERAGPTAPSVSAITEAADDTLHIVYTFIHTHS